MGLIFGSPADPFASVAGTLVRDGVATPHQLALIVNDLSSLSQSATAEVRVRTNSPQGSWSSWVNLMRVQPSESPTPPWAGGVEDVFAWTVFGLQPATTYDVELRKTLGAVVDDGNIFQFTTKAIPPEPGAVTTTIAAGQSVSQINTTLAAASPGDHIQFANDSSIPSQGIVWPSGLSGASESAPTYITGESRSGVVFDNSGQNDDAVLQFTQTLDNVVFQDFTCLGAGLDASPALEGSAAFFANGVSLENITIRRVTGTDLQKGVEFRGPNNETADIHGIMIYDCTLVGTLVYNETNLRASSYGWDNYGLLIAGDGHAAWHNTLSDFGDVFSCTSGANDSRSEEDKAQFWYWNLVDGGFDDAFEFDDGYRNVFGYQNTLKSVTNLASFDVIYGGPCGAWGNLYLAPLESRIIKYNSDGSGAVFAQNTVSVRSQPNRSDTGATDYAMWYNPPGGDMGNNIFVNNAFIKIAGTLVNGPLLVENTLTGRSDWCNNAWYPDGDFFIYAASGDINATTLAGAQADAGAANGVVFDKQLFEDDIVSVIQPFTTSISYASAAFAKVTEDWTRVDFTPNHLSLNATGVSFPGLTDNVYEAFTGAAPAIGCVVAGLTNPAIGDTSLVPTYIAGMAAYDVRQLTGSYAPTSGNEAITDVTPAEWLDETTTLGYGDLRNVIEAWCGGCAEPGGNLFAVHGGGHNDSGNNGMYLYDVRESGGRPVGWQSPLDISDAADVAAGTSDTYTDGYPRAMHTYNGMVYAPDRDLYFRCGGVHYNGSGGFANGFWQYDPNAAIGSRWTQLTDYPGNVAGAEPAAFYDQTTGKIIAFHHQYDGAIYDIDAGTWSSVISITAVSGFDAAMGYDPTRNRVCGIGSPSGTSRLWDYNLSTDAQSASSAITWTGDTEILDAASPAILYDELLDRFWLFGGDDTTLYDGIYYFDAADLDSPTNVAITRVTFNSSGDLAPTGFESEVQGTYNRYLWRPDWRAIFTVHRVDEAPWVIRLPNS